MDPAVPAGTEAPAALRLDDSVGFAPRTQSAPPGAAAGTGRRNRTGVSITEMVDNAIHPAIDCTVQTKPVCTVHFGLDFVSI